MTPYHLLLPQSPLPPFIDGGLVGFEGMSLLTAAMFLALLLVDWKRASLNATIRLQKLSGEEGGGEASITMSRGHNEELGSEQDEGRGRGRAVKDDDDNVEDDGEGGDIRRRPPSKFAFGSLGGAFDTSRVIEDLLLGPSAEEELKEIELTEFS